MFHLSAETWEDWRPQARDMIARGIMPAEVAWDSLAQPSLFGAPSLPPASGLTATIPRDFIDLARAVGCHRNPSRWNLLYRLVWRLAHGEPHLLHIGTDPLMHKLHLMEKAVRRDAHKMKAFVRFRRVQEEEDEHYIAWHWPDHRIVRLTAGFFARRFTAMKWTILTPDESVYWDGERSHFGPGVPESQAPQEDAMEDLWRDYYRAIFNPARIKINAMKREMPVRHWHTLPETRIISAMLAEAPERVERMIAHTEGSAVSAADYLPSSRDLDSLRVAAEACQGCELHHMASQTVFGVGPAQASLMIVGEQPGDEEDKQGKVFIGPAGQLLDEALDQAGLSRAQIYITNAVKHFHFSDQNGFRLHRTAVRSHIHACKPWLDAEIAAVQPRAILCLGNTAARALINPNFVMKQHRGTWIQNDPRLMATYHPAAILRARGTDREQFRQFFVEDLKKAAVYAA